MSKAARVGDKVSGHDCFPETTIISGSPDVFINGKPAARAGDSADTHACPCNGKPHGEHPRTIAEGAPTVFINSLPAARVGNSADCGGVILTGSDHVFIGNIPYQAEDHTQLLRILL